MDESIRLSASISFVFACVTAFGMVFNGMCIAYSERVRQLASLRVLGFTQAEVAWILFGEQFMLTAIALPAGLLLGYDVCGLPPTRLATDLHRLPSMVHTTTFAYALIIASGAAACLGLLVAAKIRRLDTVVVLKTRESWNVVAYEKRSHLQVLRRC